MLSRISKVALRRFSGADPYWSHLEQTPDKYPQYAHLHWTTMDVLEIGKYAKLRHDKYSDHISESPHEIDLLPHSTNTYGIPERTQNALFEMFLDSKREFTSYIGDQVEFDNETSTNSEAWSHHVLAVFKTTQITSAIQFANELIGEYKAAGVPFTSQAVKGRVITYLFDSLSKHQLEDLVHATEPFLEKWGLGLPMNLD
jgi:hypothetical protein